MSIETQALKGSSGDSGRRIDAVLIKGFEGAKKR